MKAVPPFSCPTAYQPVPSYHIVEEVLRVIDEFDFPRLIDDKPFASMGVFVSSEHHDIYPHLTTN